MWDEVEYNLLEWDEVVNHQFHLVKRLSVQSRTTNMLIGEYTHTLDDKNRLSLPAKFRKELGKSVVVAPGLDGCLSIFTEKEWQRVSEKFSEFSMLQSDNRRFHRFMFGQAVLQEVDALGRILVPEFLKDRAELGNKVVIIGVQNHLEVWNDRTWGEYKKSVDKEADALAEKLGQAGII